MSSLERSVVPSADAPAVAPDPGRAGSLDDLVKQLRLLKIWAGDPSFEWITARVNAALAAYGRPAAELAGKTTVVDCFRPGRRRLNRDLVLAIVEALHPNVGYVTQWRQALRVVTGEALAASQVRVQDRLPPDLIAFTGRTAQLDRLRRELLHSKGGGVVLVSAIAGMAGVGKTQFAIHAGHLLAREQPFDRVLYVNLRGFHPEPAQPPADPAAVLDSFLRLLGAPGQQIPHTLEARSAAYRDRLAGTRALIVLDNAVDEEQIRPLLPDTPGCLVLVTSRRSLTALQPATELTLDVFTPAEAQAFLGQIAPRVPIGADPNAPSRIAARCGHLPLALGLIGAHIRDTPGWTLTDHADRLDERHRVGRLDTGVELALDLSYRDLPADLRRLLRLAALHPGQELDEYAAAALADGDLSTAKARLEHLCRDHLLQHVASNRYALHDLVHAYATDRAQDEDPPSEHRAALTRLFDYYLASSAAAMDALYPSETHQRPKIALPDVPTPDLDRPGTARAWLDTERPTLVAIATHTANHGWPVYTTALSTTLMRYLDGGHYEDAVVVHRNACDAAKLTDDPALQANALTDLGNAKRQLGRHKSAAEDLRQALRLFRRADDPRGQARARGCLGQVEERLGNYQSAADNFRQALRLYQITGHPVGEARASASLGILDGRLGRYRAATNRLKRALTLFQQTGNHSRCAYVLISLGETMDRLGRPGPAADYFRQALSAFRQALSAFRRAGDLLGEVWSLNNLGGIHLYLGQPGRAVVRYRRALALLPDAGFQYQAAIALNGLGKASRAMGCSGEALAHHHAALAAATAIGEPAEMACAHDGLGQIYDANGDTARARDHYQHALTLYAGLGAPEADQIRARLT